MAKEQKPEEHKIIVFVTKWAFTKGILETAATPCYDDHGIFNDKVKIKDGVYLKKEGRDFHVDLASARVRVEAMRRDEIRSKEKKLAQLKKLDVSTMQPKEWSDPDGK